jgi:hypothetical protein
LGMRTWLFGKGIWLCGRRISNGARKSLYRRPRFFTIPHIDS